MPVDPFLFDLLPTLNSRAASCVARPLLSRLTGVSRLLSVYLEARQGPADMFVERALNALRVNIVVEPQALAALPKTGPLIVVANHPHGALDGLVLAAALRRIRPDVKLLANCLLSRIPELRPACFFVDPFERASATTRSLSGLRQARRWLERGGVLVIFPAGEVAGQRGAGGVPMERPWTATAARLAASTSATLVPAFIAGSNSPLFYRAARLHPLLRTALLPRELLNKQGARIHVSFAGALTPGTAPELTVRAQSSVAALSTPTCAHEVERLSPHSLLIDAGRHGVYCAGAEEIPLTLAGIGRLRAIAYRAAGEGTGSDVDLDEFDREYRHLFVWDRHEQRVVGAYRIGVVADIVRRFGVAGLYTRSLFEYGPELVDAMGPALELGRSFVRPEYQRNYQALFLLWRGIGAFVARHPEHRVLFGPVSISASYCDASHALLAAFLEQNHLDASLARLVAPRHARPSTNLASPIPVDADAADRLIRALEGDGKAMPVLLRQYLKLNARALGFSIDPKFGNVLDALMAVDLTQVQPSILRRYFGDAGAASYQAHHTRASLAA